MTAPADASGPAPDRPCRCKSLVGAATLASACLLLTSGCSSSGAGKVSTRTAAAASPSAAATSAASSSRAAAPTSAASSSPPTTPGAKATITGTWNGTFTGATSSGTFKVVFKQQGETVAGNITITGSGGNGQGTITGKLASNRITFGAIVGTAITFTGSFSGNSMSGNYKSATDSGSWKATR